MVNIFYGEIYLPTYLRKKEWIPKLELENIRRKVLQEEKDINVNNNNNTGEWFYLDKENIHNNEVTQVDTENLGEEEKKIIQDILHLMKDNCRIELRGFNKLIDVYLLNCQ